FLSFEDDGRKHDPCPKERTRLRPSDTGSPIFFRKRRQQLRCNYGDSALNSSTRGAMDGRGGRPSDRIECTVTVTPIRGGGSGDGYERKNRSLRRTLAGYGGAKVVGRAGDPESSNRKAFP